MICSNWLKNMCLRMIGVVAILVGVSNTVMAAGLMTVRGGAQLDLLEQHVEVVLENGYAVTRVDQVFTNPHTQVLDAHYSFPVPDGAAVGEFTYWIDGQAVHAEVFEKQHARQVYEQQLAVGAEAALVEKDEYRTFDMHVAGIAAGKDVRTRLVYLQRAMVDHSVGRYAYPLEEGGVDEGRDSFWSRNDTVNAAFSFDLRLRSAYPVDAVRVPTGTATVQQLDSGEWEVHIGSTTGHGAQAGAMLPDAQLAEFDDASGQLLANRNGTIRTAYQLDKDIVVYWRLNEVLPGAVDLVTYREAGAAMGTFMLTLTPGIDLKPITEGRDWIFVLDTSGSMQGKYASLVEGVRRALKSLQPADRFQIILFSDSARSLTSGYVAVDVNSVELALTRLENYSVGGGTNLYDGLKKAVSSLDADRTTALILVTDGVANVGQTRIKKFLQMMEKVDVRLFTAVMGNSANKPLLGALTEHSEGFAVNISNSDDIVGLMMQVTGKVTHEALHNVQVKISGVKVSDMTPDQLGRVYRGEQLVILGKYSGDGEAKVTLKTEISGETKIYSSRLGFPQQSLDHPELERLWAFAQIEALKDQQHLLGDSYDRQQAIADIALQHGLVTDYTSLLVVRDEVFQQNNIQRTNAARVNKEQQARTRRANQAIVPSQQDAQAPMFSGPRQTTSNGSGSMGGWMLFVMLSYVLFRVSLSFREWLGRFDHD